MYGKSRSHCCSPLLGSIQEEFLEPFPSHVQKKDNTAFCLTFIEKIGLFPAVQFSSSGFPSVPTDTCKIKAANLPSPRTDGAVSEDKSQQMKLGSLSKTQTAVFTEDMNKQRYRIKKLILCFCFQKTSFLSPPPMLLPSVVENLASLLTNHFASLLQIFFFLFTGTSYRYQNSYHALTGSPNRQGVVLLTQHFTNSASFPSKMSMVIWQILEVTLQKFYLRQTVRFYFSP